MKKKEPRGRKTPKGEPHGRKVLEVPPTGQTPKGGKPVATDSATRYEPYMLSYVPRRKR